MPEEFQPQGMRVLIEAPEFRLVENWFSSGTIRKVEWAEPVRMAFLCHAGNKQKKRDKTRFEDARWKVKREEICSMMQALHLLTDYTEKGGCKTICDLMKAALERSLIAIKDAQDTTRAKIAIEDAMTLCTSALSGFAVMAGTLKDSRRSTSKPTPADIIKIADFLIACEACIPSKEKIRKFAEGTGLIISGHLDIDGQWMQLFTDAGLSGLP
jgi:hypothetical protein